MIKVSVVMPVYNCATYLRTCLDSVINQTLSAIEIICVDDGSTDGSFEILKEYEEKDSRVRALKQEHKFAGAARNLGKSHASGEYITFWDSDDYFEPNALELLYNKSVETEADVCVCGAYKFYTGMYGIAPYDVYLIKPFLKGPEVFNRESNPDYILNFTTAVPWNKLYRRQYIEDCKLDFQEIRNANDVFFTINALARAERIATVGERLMGYRVNIGEGLVATLSKAPLNPCNAWISAAESLKEHGAFPERSFANKACDSIMYVLQNISARDAFVEAVEFLKHEGLAKLHMQIREPGYYYGEWKNDFIKHLTEDTPDEMMAYLAHETYVRGMKQEATLRLDKQKLTIERDRLNREKQALLQEKQKLVAEKETLKEKNKKLEAGKKKAEKELKSIKGQKLYKILVKIRRILNKFKGK